MLYFDSIMELIFPVLGQETIDPPTTSRRSFPLPHSFHSPDAVVFLCRALGRPDVTTVTPLLQHTHRVTGIPVLRWPVPTVHVMPTAHVQFPIEGPHAFKVKI